jgi:hypothetical protein
MTSSLRLRIAAVLSAMVAGVMALALADGRAGRESTVRQQNACYPGQFSAFSARRVKISDSVAKLTAIVRRPVDACAPAAIDRAKAANMRLYLICYEISAPPVGPRSLGYVLNPLGKFRLRVKSARALCVSSARAPRAPARLRLTCYGVVLVRASSKRVDKTITDTFGTSRDSVSVGRPVSFCTGRQQGLKMPLHLACYRVVSETAGRTIVLTNEWGVVRTSLGLRDRLCIQSSLRR